MKTATSYLKALIPFCFVGTFLITNCDVPSIEEKQIHVVFRFDDYSARSSTETELRIINAFRNNNASITFGVIPFVCDGDIHDPFPMNIIPLTSEKGDILKRGLEDGVLDIALHGYSHQTTNAERMKEFPGLDYKTQLERLTKGKEFLEEIIEAPVTAFIPPWNKYDLNTLRALENAGFSTLSANMNGETTEDSKLNFLPATCGLSRLRDAVSAVRASSDTQPLIVVLFHQYDFKEVDKKRGKITYQEFSYLLTWLKSQKDIRLLSIKQATKAIDDLSALKIVPKTRPTRHTQQRL